MPTVHKVVALTALLYLLSCQADPETWQRGKALACDSCTSDLDCAAGLLCDQDAFACKSVDQLKAKKLNPGAQECDADCWKECVTVGGCYALPIATNPKAGKRCFPKSAADCAASSRCKGGYYCKYSEDDGTGMPGCVQ